MSESDPFLGRLIADRYETYARIGRGGMGTVYRARQRGLDRDVALKVIRLDLAHDPDIALRFEREARTVARLSHPHLVNVYDFGGSDGALFLAMEHLDGTPLSERLRQRPALTLKSALAITRDVCAALDHAHHNGVIHRDLKPDNIILVNVEGRDDFAKVLDFGIAKIVDAPDDRFVTSSRVVLGTPGYVAPEVIVGGMSNDPRADLYALGVVLFEMLTGRAPYTTTSPGATLVAQVSSDAPRVAGLVGGLPSAVSDLVASLVARDPLERPRDARTVLAMLDELLARLTQTDDRSLSASVGTAPARSGTASFFGTGPGSTLSFTSVPPTCPTESAIVLPQAVPTPQTGMVISPSPSAPPDVHLPPRPRPRLRLVAAASIGVLVGGALFALGVLSGAPRKPEDAARLHSTVHAQVVSDTRERAAPAGDEPLAAPAAAIVAQPQGALHPAPEPGPSASTTAPTVPAADTRRRARPVKAHPVKAHTAEHRTEPSPESVPTAAEAPSAPGLPALTSELVRTGIQRMLGKASACTNTNLKRARVGSGLLVEHCPSYRTVDEVRQLSLVVAPDGTVMDARFLDEAPHGQRIETCILESFRTWRFPAFAGDAPVEIRQRLAFEPCVPINGKCIF